VPGRPASSGGAVRWRKRWLIRGWPAGSAKGAGGAGGEVVGGER
jgi:hypothetical protein